MKTFARPHALRSAATLDGARCRADDSLLVSLSVGPDRSSRASRRAWAERATDETGERDEDSANLHYGLIAEWWAEFITDGPEIDYFGRYVEREQPALDAGCGTGRLLLPWLRAGLDVDGCDVSADMISLCRDRARRDGFDPTLVVQALHDLDPPRSYRTIVGCGVFGLGSTRAQDQEALRRFRRCLEPGGTLLLDNEVPYANAYLWRCWTREERQHLPAAWPSSGERRRTADGAELALRSRTVAVDPLDQTAVVEMRAEKWRGGELEATEDHAISMRMYFRDELLLMLDHAGFIDVDVRGDYTDEPPSEDHEFLVYIART
jgi:SAM-dependent methyltransferase